MDSKICSKCGINKPISEFYFIKKRNIFKPECRECIKEYSKEYKKIWRKVKAKEIKDYSKAYYQLNTLEIKEKVKKWTIKNREKQRKSRNIYVSNRKLKDPLFKLTLNARSLIRNSFINFNFKKISKTTTALGCTIEKFKEHLEKQFEPWMNWDNYGQYKLGEIRTWNIDHIIPLASAKTEEDIIKLNHHTNLRPLCSKENLDKRDKII